MPADRDYVLLKKQCVGIASFTGMDSLQNGILIHRILARGIWFLLARTLRSKCVSNCIFKFFFALILNLMAENLSASSRKIRPR